MPPLGETKLNPKRSQSSVPFQCNLPPDVAQLLREWAGPYAGRTGMVLAKLVWEEAERKRIRRLLGETTE